MELKWYYQFGAKVLLNIRRGIARKITTLWKGAMEQLWVKSDAG